MLEQHNRRGFNSFTNICKRNTSKNLTHLEWNHNVKETGTRETTKTKLSRKYIEENFRNHPTSQVLVRGGGNEGNETHEFTAPKTVIGELEASSNPRWNTKDNMYGTLCKRGLS